MSLIQIFSLTRLFSQGGEDARDNENVAKIIYQPLAHDDSIRLLYLEPAGVFWRTIRCHLENRRLCNNTAYIALSYVWGPATPSHQITVNDLRFEIRDNLYYALRKLRHAKKRRIFWIDAVCINQHDVPERNQQVKLMKRVYERAKITVVWLGRLGSTDKVQEKALIMLQAARFPTPGRPQVDSVENITQKLQSPFTAGDTIAGLSLLLSNSWFSRAWVQQEFAVSSNVRFVLGDFCLLPGTVQYFILAIDALPLNLLGIKQKAGQPRHLFRTRELHRDQGCKVTLSYLLFSTFDSAEATDPRDMAYSLLGLADDVRELAVPINYEASVESVFTDAVTRCLVQDPRDLFKILDLVGCEPAGIYDNSLPSWVPDFTSRHTFYQCFSTWGEFNASGGSRIPASIIDKNTLLVEGKIVARIGIYMRYPFAMNAPVTQRGSRLWLEECRAVAMNSATECEEAWWRTLVCDVWWPEGVRQAAKEGYGAFYLHPEVLLQESIQKGRSTLKAVEFLKAQQDFDQTRQCTSSRLGFCVTEDGMLGWVPQGARKADRICIFAGAKAPFIVREKGDGSYRLVGSAYIHGIMYGETMDWPGMEWEDIELS